MIRLLRNGCVTRLTDVEEHNCAARCRAVASSLIADIIPDRHAGTRTGCRSTARPDWAGTPALYPIHSVEESLLPVAECGLDISRLTAEINERILRTRRSPHGERQPFRLLLLQVLLDADTVDRHWSARRFPRATEPNRRCAGVVGENVDAIGFAADSDLARTFSAGELE